MNLKNLTKLFADKNCDKLYVKVLQKNNNSKQQIYVSQGKDTEVLNLFPIDEFRAESGGTRKTVSFFASVTFYWLNNDGIGYHAPEAKFIYYPDYPEVRFSGFLRGCKKAPKEILNNPIADRLLFFGVSKDGNVYGYAVLPESEAANEFYTLQNLPKVGVLFVLNIADDQIITDSKHVLLNELKRIHLKGWIPSKELRPGNIILPCRGNRCPGLTLEAELGIIQNGKSEPDYMGWEIKQFGVRKMHLIRSSRITLMTPEPDGGFYRRGSFYAFLQKYGYTSATVIDRLDFTGTHRFGKIHKKTKLTLYSDGYDVEKNETKDASGGIYLVSEDGEVAASWSFEKLLSHWVKKHSKAVYVPSMSQKAEITQFRYSNEIIICEGTDFSFFMKGLVSGLIYYDPGMHIESTHGKQEPKKRSQFRITSKAIFDLYSNVNVVDVNNV